MRGEGIRLGFTSIQIYKVLKLRLNSYRHLLSFTSIQIYKVLKLMILNSLTKPCFTSIQIYKVLKPIEMSVKADLCFTSIQIYKVLKHHYPVPQQLNVLLLYKFTRFSNTAFLTVMDFVGKRLIT